MFDLDAMIEGLRAHVAGNPDIAVVYLFGSAARGEPPRDLDLAVLFGRPVADPLQRVLGLQVVLEAAAGASVDLHDFDDLPVDVQFRVLDEGRAIVVRDEVARVRREVKAMLEYYDFKPYLDRIREGGRARMANG